jgi:hypothetical protein
MDKKEWQEYINSPNFKEDLQYCSQLVKRGDYDGLVSYLSRHNEERAEQAVRRIRNAQD